MPRLRYKQKKEGNETNNRKRRRSTKPKKTENQEAPAVNLERFYTDDVNETPVIHEEDPIRNIHGHEMGSDTHSEILPIPSQKSNRDPEIQSLSDSALIILASALETKMTQHGFEMTICAIQDTEEREKVLKLWNGERSNYENVLICNECGRILVTRNCSCGGTVAKFTRIGIGRQLHSLIASHSNEIDTVHSYIRRKVDVNHILTSPYYRQMPMLDSEDKTYLSLHISVDGVTPSGNTNKKVWPISMSLLDLSTMSRQRSENMLLGGVITCEKNPSTLIWNVVMKNIETELKEVIKIGSKIYYARIVSAVGDQPAKRAFFGILAQNCTMSCFYCISDGTLHKKKGKERYVERRNETLQDSKNGEFGFSMTPSRIIETLLPWDCVIDIFHCYGEGVAVAILGESLPQLFKYAPPTAKSEIFKASMDDFQTFSLQFKTHSKYKDSIKLRTGTDKSNFFRIQFACFALKSKSMNIYGRIIVLGLTILLGHLCTGCETSQGFYTDICRSLADLFDHVSHKYYTIKMHEIIFHLPYNVSKFGQISTLSTESFEHLYKKIISDYQNNLTSGFAETIATRFVTKSNVLEEVIFRKSNSEQILNFCKLSRRKGETDTEFTGQIDNLAAADEQLLQPNVKAYSVWSSTIGPSRSRYYNTETIDDLLFFRAWAYSCGRFVLATQPNLLLVEPFTDHTEENAYDDLYKKSRHLPNLNFIACSRILAHLRGFKGIRICKPTNSRIWVRTEDIQGVGSYLISDPFYYCIQCNGVPIHH